MSVWSVERAVLRPQHDGHLAEEHLGVLLRHDLLRLDILAVTGSFSPVNAVVMIDFAMSTYSGAEYVRLRSLPSLGKSVEVMPSASVTIGLD